MTTAAGGQDRTTAQADDRPVAVIDIGSGATKLLVVDRAGLAEPGTELAHRGIKTRLHTTEGGELGEHALDATADALDVFAQVLADHQPSMVSVVGTAWARAASNLEPLQLLVKDKLQAELEVLTGHREAELSYIGALAGRDLPGPVSVMDVGGGSTEFAVALDRPGATAGGSANRGGNSLQTFSLPIGGRMISETYLLSDPPQPAELSSALSVVELHLDDLRRELPGFAEAVETGTVVSVGATRQISEVEIGLVDPAPGEVDGYRLEKVAAEEVFRALATESRHDRAFNPGLRAEDVEDIVGAICILVEFMRQFSVMEIVISERALMHGLAAELLAKR